MQSASKRLEIAGEAAEILESMGFTSMGRSKDGIVTLTAIGSVRGASLAYVHVVDYDVKSAHELALRCAAEFRARHRLGSVS